MASKNEQRKIEIIADGKKANASIKEMRASVSLLNNQLNKLPQGTKEFVAKSKELKQVKQRLQEVTDEAKNISPALENGNFLMDLLGKGAVGLRQAFNLAVRALLPLFAFQQLMELARHFWNVSEAARAVREDVARLTDLEGEALNTVSAQVRATGRAFEKDHNEVLKAGNAIVQSWKGSYEDAFNLINTGLIEAVDLNGDFLDQIYEYAPQFEKAGYSAEQMVAHLIHAEKAGIFSDKGADVVKEFEIRIKEATKATTDALEAAFGKEYTTELFNNLKSGAMTGREALMSVSEQMDSNKANAQELQTVIADVFGGPGEDAGLKYLQSLHNIDGGLEAVIDSTDLLTQRRIEQLRLEQELAEAENDLSLELAGLSTGMSKLWKYTKLYATEALVVLLEHFRHVKYDAIGMGALFGQLSSNIMDFFKSVASGDWETMKEGFSNLGKDLMKSYNEAYMAQYNADMEARKQKQQQELEEQAAMEEASLESRHTSEISKLKEHQEKVAAEREKLRLMELEAQRALQDLKLALMDEGLEKELERIDLEYERKWEKIQGNEQQIKEQQDLMKQLWEEEKELARQEHEQMKFEQDMLKLTEEEEMKKLVLENQFLQALATEAERDQQMLDLKKASAEARLELLRQQGKAESAEAMKVQNEILAIEKAKADAKIEQDNRAKEHQLELEALSYDAMRDFMDLGIGLIEEEQKAKSKNANFFKGFTIGKIMLDSAQEIQAIWRNMNANPLNALIPGWGAIQAAIQTGMAVSRTKRAISQVNSQGFYQGGFTGSGLSVGSNGKLMDNSGHAVAGVVHANEWVGPQWMVDNPKYANVFRWLESERTRRFATGGETSPNAIARNPASGSSTEVMSMVNALANRFDNYAAKVDSWARTLRVNNDPRDIQEGIQVMNEVDNDSDIS